MPKSWRSMTIHQVWVLNPYFKCYCSKSIMSNTGRPFGSNFTWTDSNQALLIGNIVTGCVTNKPTTLQIALGVLLREKQLIDDCHAFGICASYDEIFRFKSSAAHASSNKAELRGLFNRNSGLIQAVAYNYDVNVSSPNGLRSTNALALLLI